MATAWTLLGGGLGEALVEVWPTGGDAVLETGGTAGQHASAACSVAGPPATHSGAGPSAESPASDTPGPHGDRRIRFAPDTKPGCQPHASFPRGTLTPVEGQDVFEIAEELDPQEAALFDKGAPRVAHTPMYGGARDTALGVACETTRASDLSGGIAALSVDETSQPTDGGENAVAEHVFVRPTSSAFVSPAERVREMQQRRLRFQRDASQ